MNPEIQGRLLAQAIYGELEKIAGLKTLWGVAQKNPQKGMAGLMKDRSAQQEAIRRAMEMKRSGKLESYPALKDVPIPNKPPGIKDKAVLMKWLAQNKSRPGFKEQAKGAVSEAMSLPMKTAAVSRREKAMTGLAVAGLAAGAGGALYAQEQRKLQEQAARRLKRGGRAGALVGAAGLGLLAQQSRKARAYKHDFHWIKNEADQASRVKNRRIDNLEDQLFEAQKQNRQYQREAARRKSREQHMKEFREDAARRNAQPGVTPVARSYSLPGGERVVIEPVKTASIIGLGKLGLNPLKSMAGHAMMGAAPGAVLGGTAGLLGADQSAGAKGIGGAMLGGMLGGAAGIGVGGAMMRHGARQALAGGLKVNAPTGKAPGLIGRLRGQKQQMKMMPYADAMEMGGDSAAAAQKALNEAWQQKVNPDFGPSGFMQAAGYKPLLTLKDGKPIPGGIGGIPGVMGWGS